MLRVWVDICNETKWKVNNLYLPQLLFCGGKYARLSMKNFNGTEDKLRY